MKEEPESLEETLRQARAQVAWLESQRAPLQSTEDRARKLLTQLTRRRQRAQQSGVPSWDGAQRAALRMVVLGFGCIALITGASAFDAGLSSGVAIVVSLALLGLESTR
jgi:hypothetical protein